VAGSSRYRYRCRHAPTGLSFSVRGRVARTKERKQFFVFEGCSPRPDGKKSLQFLTNFWGFSINVECILKEYRALRKASLKEPKQQQLSSRIYAKNVFPQIVLVELNKLQEEIESEEWIPKLATWFPTVPADIVKILKRS